MPSFAYTASREDDTERLGQALAAVLPAGSVVALVGTLGAGKTRLVQALATACGVPRAYVVSPTFVLCQEYHGQRSLYHFDTYRLKDEQEFLQLGIEEYYAAGGIVLIEWADRVRDALPSDYLEIRIEVLGDEQRLFSLTTCGDFPAETLDRLRQQL